METTPDGLSVSDLAAANIANYFAMLDYVGRSPFVDCRQGSPLSWMISGLPPPSMNAVWIERAGDGELDRAMGDALAYFRQKHVSVTSWWPRPGVDAAELRGRLEAYGLAYDEGEPGMAADLRALAEELRPPRGLVIEPVTSEDALHRFVHAALAGFGAPAPFAPHMFEVYASLGFDLPLRSYVGTVGGELVASSQLFLDGRAAGIYIVATVPKARGRGIGAEMTLAAMRDARDLGYRVATLQASEMGYPVYRRLGFREVCRMSHWG